MAISTFLFYKSSLGRARICVNGGGVCRDRVSSASASWFFLHSEHTFSRLGSVLTLQREDTRGTTLGSRRLSGVVSYWRRD